LLTNLAFSYLGRTSVNLNYTLAKSSLDTICGTAGLRTVISSKAFLAKLEGFSPPVGTLMLEDLVAGIGTKARLWALVRARLFPIRKLIDRTVLPDDVATLIFSSGSTGEPKGAMLTHHNVVSNVESYCMVMRFSEKDRLCAILPFFHSFGFTCTLWCPLLKGFGAYYHANPLESTQIGEWVQAEKLTVLLTTPTFLLSYIRRVSREQFASLRLIIAGAEKLKDKIADAFAERFGLRPLEGYGATELSPVASISLPDTEVAGVSQCGTRAGSVGHPIPGVAARVIEPSRGELQPPDQQGLLMIKGPNVMKGYLNRPDKTAEVIRDGWYDTGDIAKVDEDGFIHLVDRASRYSKIGGEMVPHLALEDKLMQALGAYDRVIAVTAINDERKGEQLVVLHTDEAGDAERIYRLVKDSDLPNLWKPKKENIFRVDKMPILGSGKLDLRQLKNVAQTCVETRPAVMQRIVNHLRHHDGTESAGAAPDAAAGTQREGGGEP